MSDKVYNEDDLRRVAAIFSEQIKGQLDAVMEAVGGMQGPVALIPQIQEDVAELKDDMKAVKAAITATNRDVADLDTRVGRLEAAA